MSRIRTSLPISTQPWKAAKAKFLDGLSPEQIVRFNDATLENTFQAASAAQKSHSHIDRGWVLRQRISSLVDDIDEYGKALEIFPNTSGLILSHIWGGLRVVLHVSHYYIPNIPNSMLSQLLMSSRLLAKLANLKRGSWICQQKSEMYYHGFGYTRHSSEITSGYLSRCPPPFWIS
jgi:hypothetical protein